MKKTISFLLALLLFFSCAAVVDAINAAYATLP